MILKKKRESLLFCTILFIFLTIKGFAFEIDSTAFEQRIDGGGYREFSLNNRSEKTVRYKIEIKEDERDGKQKDMSKWVEVYPKVMTIPPLQKRVLKVFAKSPLETPKGEYGFRLIITPLNVPTLSEKQGKIQVNSSIDFIPVIYMYGHVGDPEFEKNIELENSQFTVDKKTERVVYSGVVRNKSFAGIELGIKFLTTNSTVVEGKYLGRIRRNSEKLVDIFLSKDFIPKKIKRIVIYDAVSLKKIKQIEL